MLKREQATTDTPRVRLWITTGLAVVVALLVAPAALADTSPSANWSGYAVHHAGISFRTVSASWRQPTASCTPGRPAYSAFWVGLGGFSPTSGALEQIGTETDCTAGGRPVLSAWYELVPAPSRPIRMAVRPGDAISATVIVVGHRVTLTLDDLTRHRSFSKILIASAIDVSSAEWIVEAPSECFTVNSCQTLPLADFGTAQFNAARAQSTKGRVATIAPAPWSNTKIVLTPSGRRFVTLAGDNGSSGSALPSALQAGGSAFSVSFLGQSNRPLAVHAARDTSGRLYH